MLKTFQFSDLPKVEEIDFNDHGLLKQEFLRTRELCRMLSLIIEELPDTIYVTDGNANTMLVNKAFEEVSGFDRSEIIGMNMREMCEKKYISTSSTLMVLDSNKPVDIKLLFIKSGNQVFIHSKPVFDANGKISMVLSNTRNFFEIRALEERLIAAENLAEHYKSEIDAMHDHFFAHHDIIAVDQNAINTLHKAHKVSKVNSTILLLGETGTGKEEYAKFIHANSMRSNNRFISVNCGALTESLIESELFGYEKGAFTGAHSKGKMGIFEVADGGSVFLDEIGEMPLEMQVKLLRVLQEKQITRIGGSIPTDVDIRIIAATNRDLKELVEQKLFREDLYYRLSVIPIYIPPLRERPMDIIPLVNHFLHQYNKQYNFHKRFSSLAIHALKEYNWPGNVRELKNVVEQAVIMTEGDRISINDLPIGKKNIEKGNHADNDIIDLKEIIERTEFEYIEQAYEKYSNIRMAAQSLNMNYTTYERKRIHYTKKYT